MEEEKKLIPLSVKEEQIGGALRKESKEELFNGIFIST